MPKNYSIVLGGAKTAKRLGSRIMVSHANDRFLQRALPFPTVSISSIINAEQREEARKYKNVAFVLARNGQQLFLSIVRGQQTETCLVTDRQGLSPKRLRVDKVIYAC